MKIKQLLFFAIFSDIELALGETEAAFDVLYYEMGLFDEASPTLYKSNFDVPHLGFSVSNDWNYDRQLLVINKSKSINIRSVPQKKGGIKYAIDPLVNTASVCLQLGGVVEGKKVLVAGKLHTASDDRFAIEYFNFLAIRIKKDFKKIGDFYICRKAEENLRSGWRLVLDEGRSQEYDLRIDFR